MSNVWDSTVERVEHLAIAAVEADGAYFDAIANLSRLEVMDTYEMDHYEYSDHLGEYRRAEATLDDVTEYRRSVVQAFVDLGLDPCGVSDRFIDETEVY